MVILSFFMKIFSHFHPGLKTPDVSVVQFSLRKKKMHILILLPSVRAFYVGLLGTSGSLKNHKALFKYISLRLSLLTACSYSCRYCPKTLPSRCNLPHSALCDQIPYLSICFGLFWLLEGLRMKIRVPVCFCQVSTNLIRKEHRVCTFLYSSS